MNESNHAAKKAGYENYMLQFQAEKIVRLQDGGSSFLDEIDEEQSRPMTGNRRNPDSDLNSAYHTNEELLGDLKVKDFDIFEVVINKFNMQSSAGQNHGCFSQ